MISKNDARLKEKSSAAAAAPDADKQVIRHIPQVDSALFFKHNEALVPPYQVIVE